MPELNPMNSVKSVSQYLGVAQSTVWAILGQGDLKSVLIAGRRMIRREDLEAYINAAAATTPQPKARLRRVGGKG
jgi:excisionase family DNA binding protein